MFYIAFSIDRCKIVYIVFTLKTLLPHFLPMLSSLTLVRLWPRVINIPRRMLCADSVRGRFLFIYIFPIISSYQANRFVL